MASTYTNLGVELMATGENAGTWGTKTNANLNLVEQLTGGYLVQTLNAAGAGANTTTLDIDDGALTGAAQNKVIILGAVSAQAITGNKIVTVPLLAETFYIIKNSTQTLTNKTLTAPKIGTSILDTGGNELFLLTATGSAVNELTYANGATGDPPTFTASGESDVGITLAAKGTGVVQITSSMNPTITSTGKAMVLGF